MRCCWCCREMSKDPGIFILRSSFRPNMCHEKDPNQFMWHTDLAKMPWTKDKTRKLASKLGSLYPFHQLCTSLSQTIKPHEHQDIFHLLLSLLFSGEIHWRPWELILLNIAALPLDEWDSSLSFKWLNAAPMFRCCCGCTLASISFPHAVTPDWPRVLPSGVELPASASVFCHYC